MIAPGVVVTCAHVVAGAQQVQGRIGPGAEFPLTVADGDRYRAANGLDIAFLRSTGSPPTSSPRRTPHSATACGPSDTPRATTRQASGRGSSTRATPG
ncbi:hypothetical protein ACIRBZ_04425 [Streptomyces sp. NPDC094038]|uniref:hypothetical protein n=1 Tax=Streptomyces sp. NPDC094038 TaxID=3366055 RepID=UPI0038049C0E